MTVEVSGILARCIAPWPALGICLLFFSLLRWDCTFEGEDRRSKVPFSQCLKVCVGGKHIPHSVDFGHLLGFSTVSLFPHTFCSGAGRQEEGREGRKGRRKGRHMRII